MPTECSAKESDFGRAGGRWVVADFRRRDVFLGRRALLLGEADKAIRLIDRFAACFRDARHPADVLHDVRKLVAQRVFGLALGYEDLGDHDEVRRDPILGAMLGKLEHGAEAPAPLAGKSTLNRMEHAPEGATGRYHKIGHDSAAIAALFVDLFLDAHSGCRVRSCSTSTPPTIRCMAIRRGGSSMAITTAIAICRSTSSAAGVCWPPGFGARTSMPAPARRRRRAGIVGQIRARWPKVKIVLRADSGFAARR
jgi:hypothetical protein